MQRQSNRDHYRHGGRSRNIQEREPAFSSELGYVSGSSDENRTSNAYSSYQQQRAQSNGYVHGPSHPQHAQPGQYYDTHQHWHSVPRWWEKANPEAYQVTQDPALARPAFAPSSNSRDSHRHNSMSQHLHQPQPSHHQESAADTQRPRLTLSNLDQFNDRYAPITNMDRWTNDGQRNGPYDRVGYVPVRGEGTRRSNGY